MFNYEMFQIFVKMFHKIEPLNWDSGIETGDSQVSLSFLFVKEDFITFVLVFSNS
jgi:hypothetical protein